MVLVGIERTVAARRKRFGPETSKYEARRVLVSGSENVTGATKRHQKNKIACLRRKKSSGRIEGYHLFGYVDLTVAVLRLEVSYYPDCFGDGDAEANSERDRGR
ncbi:hypothetical protein OUZ56_021839 [Daphnia magna]|uniref:Uncharacterized protein n=1 Tax=Daphnia magna TaxID=35525 RepID=A0ABR0AUM2_9CRUS|nr:hypothetical protein OUZ56_021839 [Daphnia magna]